MRWSIIRTIWLREMRDQLRDRRTLFMMLGLPLLLYPILGFAVLRFAVEHADQPSVLGLVSGNQNSFPPFSEKELSRSRADPLTYPKFVESGTFTTFDSTAPKAEARAMASQARFEIIFLDKVDATLLEERKVDLILEAAADFDEKLKAAEGDKNSAPQVKIHGRSDDRSRIALSRLAPLLERWKQDLKKIRLARKGLPEKFLEPIDVALPAQRAGPFSQQSAIDLVVRVFPFMVVMWSLAGALYPAVDLCAGEKERGTMETLLITPAGREEIVLGKFLTIWVFSSGTALFNLLSMGITTAQFSGYLPHGGISIPALFWCVVLSLPQSAFFSALGLAIGAYARSSKEGQYYLMPLFILTMPLIFLTLAPGVELNALYSLVPVTGVALLMQRLMTAPTLAEIPWAYFVPVLFPIALYSWLALRWAIEQFNREDVLFREAERLDLVLWLKSLFREKEPTPTAGQAFFCLALVIGMRWMSLGFGNMRSLELHTVITQVALVAAPALFMALLLNTQPRDTLYLHRPHARDTGLAALLAILMLPPLAGMTQAVGWWFPNLLDGVHPIMQILRVLRDGANVEANQLLLYVFAFALVPAVCEELAFRGFVLRGLHHGFRPRNAVLLSSFFFALFHLNVFLFLPTFLLGVVLGLLTVRSKSLLPAICFHLLHNCVLIGLIPVHRYSEDNLPRILTDVWPWLIGGCLIAATTLVWWLYRKPYVDLARKESLSRSP